MHLHTIREVLEDADPFFYIVNGAYNDCYDPVAEYISPRLYADISIDQLQSVIWDGFYHFVCNGIIPGENETFSLDKTAAMYILGDSSRFKGLAANIRYMVYGI